MPMSPDFYARLRPILPDLIRTFATPFHIYDEIGIRDTGTRLIEAFSAVPNFKEYYAVKALPNPRILELMRDLNFGFDCSSIPELILSRQIGARGEDIMFTSNNTSDDEFAEAFREGGCILNLDDISLLRKLPTIPARICFRYNPGARRTGNAIIGSPEEAKYGVSHDQIRSAYQQAKALGVQRFGIHTMLISNELNYHYMLQTTAMLLELIEWLSDDLAINFEFINIGGGLGIPYSPADAPFDVTALGREIALLLQSFERKHGDAPHLYMESGRYLTGSHGVLVTTVLNRKDTYRTYIGVDASMSALMRPAMYGAYHHITVHGKEDSTSTTPVDVVGALCENNDKFAIQRPLPAIDIGDALIIHDTGAHGQAMGFNYNGRLRPKELLLRQDGTVELIRREETIDDYFATLQFPPQLWQPKPNNVP